MKIFYKKESQKEYKEITQEYFYNIKEEVFRKNINSDDYYKMWYLDIANILDDNIYIIERYKEVI